MRSGAGKTEKSWRKHDLVRRVVNAQAGALQFKHGPGIIIDMHAGDGAGVEVPQLSLFGSNPSRPTPEIAVRLGCENVGIVLCERDSRKRAALRERWSAVTVVGDHRLAVEYIKPEHRWAVVLNDPNGPADHGVEWMQAISRRLPRSDFIIVVNDGALRRINGVMHPDLVDGMRRYEWMVDWPEWKRRIGREFIAVSGLVRQSQGFSARVLVVSNFLTDGVRRNRFFEVL